MPWDPVRFIDTLFVTSVSSASCKKEWMNTENWDVVRKEQRRTSFLGSHTFFYASKTVIFNATSGV